MRRYACEAKRDRYIQINWYIKIYCVMLFCNE